ncbi:cell wall hydrolase [Peribacillus psychrosaccharolyticus]|uniref:Cell wall hydrolase n=2 Tax=Peribacillus psychrosaccharolyticus TaxID=1407 RepID=A0A974NRX4_PERPY|nr:cell wall hydrolase [Peribacillus psychrosaccharolyticus]
MNSETLANKNTKKHTVKQGESIWDIAKMYGVPIQVLKDVNKNENNVANPGDTFTIPSVVSETHKELLSRLVHAEAKGEPYNGKVAVAAVVLNRVQDDEFPDSIKDVIYQKGQFSPVDDGAINQPAGEDAQRAVNEAIAIQDYAYHELYFYNPSISDSKWMRTLKVVRVIGGHHFAI